MFIIIICRIYRGLLMIFDFKSDNIKLVVIDDETNSVVTSSNQNQVENYSQNGS